MRAPRRSIPILLAITAIIFLAAACQIAEEPVNTPYPVALPTDKPVAAETAVPPETSPTAEEFLFSSSQKTPFPKIEIPVGPTPENYGLPGWVEVQSALLAEFLPGYELENARCEWEFLGHDEALRKVFVWMACEANAFGSAKTIGSLPGILYMDEAGKIEKVFIPKVGDEIQSSGEFPADIIRKINNWHSEAPPDMIGRLILRREHPYLPPAAGMPEGKDVVKPISTLEGDPPWRKIERALAKDWYSGKDEDILCEWIKLGEIDGKLYLQPKCEPVDRDKRMFAMPYCILTMTEARDVEAIECHEAVDLGNGYGLDPKYFPQEIREAYHLTANPGTVMMDHIALRRWYRDLPPLQADEVLQP